ncbi:tRNA lysidine(34) synthetase TilS [Chitinivorax sp. B]|uniref:tRNA lysidine(34) synthetase TilS n=1 Tax=Chitinivorax sp. B TaxID=2502235 RepID=UPI0010F9EFAB|nr:tRNA lysidine(34) synthetase TilS [Chitinivorax sp. B]
MVSSRKLPLDERLKQHLYTSLTPYTGRPVSLALSGGMDSVALFDLAVAVAPSLDISLSALHVNHQISPNAPAWVAFCRSLCATHAIPLTVETVRLDRQGGQSLEAVARDARYAAFSRLPVAAILLAHHLDDQAETVLLQLMRGGGVRGMAAMPAARLPACAPALLRPLLACTRADLQTYADQRQLCWVEDESNLDTRYDRNFMRHEVLPLLIRTYPQASRVLSRTAGLCAEAAEMQDALAELDVQGDPQSGWLCVKALQALSPARAKNVLRWFVARAGLSLSASMQQAVLTQLLHCRVDADPRLVMGGYFLARYDGRIWLVKSVDLDVISAPITWRGELLLSFPALVGELHLLPVHGKGLAEHWLRQPLRLQLRRGGEVLRPRLGGPRRPVKALLQEARIPPWIRSRLPLLYAGEQLLAVPGVAVDAAAIAREDERGYRLRWNLIDA